jgi:alpha-methylacyl-CoA racemase
VTPTSGAGAEPEQAQRSGPLNGVRIVEIGSIGPGPFAAMVLADLGADVIRLERRTTGGGGVLEAGTWNLLHRGRPSVAIDLKQPGGRDLVITLCGRSEGLIEGFRPGVMERLGLGPNRILRECPHLVYGRMTGYGQTGPMARVAGHDINYIALAGALASFREAGHKPLAPLNLVGDFGGGGMLLALGLVSAILEARVSGQGQVVDAAMVDGAALMMTLFYGLRSAEMWTTEAGTNFLDSGAPFYNVYETSDGGHVAVGAIEPQFYDRLLEVLEIEPRDAPQWDRAGWPSLKLRFAEIFSLRTRGEWVERLEHAEACATGVYTMEEAATHRHLTARETFVEVDGVVQPAPAPRFSRTPATIASPPHTPGADTDSALEAWGIEAHERDRLRQTGAIG